MQPAAELRGLEAIDRGTIEALRCDGASLQVVHLRRRRRAPREGGTWRTRLSFPGAGEDPTRLRTSASSESVRAHTAHVLLNDAPIKGSPLAFSVAATTQTFSEELLEQQARRGLGP